MPMSALPFIAFALGYVLFLYFVGRHFWRRFKKESVGSTTFNFRITDIWAAMITLTPSLIVISYALKFLDERGWENEHTINNAVLGFALTGGQITGMFVGRICGDLPLWGGRKSDWDSASLIIHGGFMGMFALPMIYFFPAILLLIFLLISPEIFFAIIALFLLVRSLVKKPPTVI